MQILSYFNTVRQNTQWINFTLTRRNPCIFYLPCVIIRTVAADIAKRSGGYLITPTYIFYPFMNTPTITRIHNESDDARNVRCGHNFPYKECPYDHCATRDMDERMAEAEALNLELRRRIHFVEKHNQYFQRCESAWCNPSADNDPAKDAALARADAAKEKP
jgi:hypothetical protein